jgi:transmembrane sensor
LKDPEKLMSAREEGAFWTTMLEGDMSEDQRQEMLRWIAESPANERELSRYRALLGMVQDLPGQKVASLLALPVPQSRWVALREFFSHPVRAGACAFAVALFAFGIWSNSPALRESITQTYTTGTNETRTVVLKDGTVAHLNTRSRIRWIGSGRDRRVLLERGEVLFDVSHDATRPFHVIVGSSDIQDLATQFDVYRKSNGSVVVTVISGQVAVKELVAKGAQPAWNERSLRPNQQLEYSPASLIADVHAVSAAKAVRWREGVLETEGLTFDTVVNELNRYSNKQLLIADPRLSTFGSGIGGTLPIHDVYKALERIQLLAPVVVTDTGDSFVLSYKGDAPNGTSNSNAGRHNVNADQHNAAGRP